ncbi:MAG: cysteine synthase A [Oscillospiraceae bacterium]|nr:cysteine synthase A [Oscillospiraceae bacterium]
MQKIAQNLTDLIGKTPLLELCGYGNEHCLKARIIAKLEYFNPLGSVKDRVGAAMITDAEQCGRLKPGGTIIESTSGNTGIGLAFTAAVRGYKLVLTMPETMSVERQKLLKALGTEIILTDGAGGMNGAILKAEELNGQMTDSVILGQFTNHANTEIHRKTTAVEICDDIEEAGERIDFFVCGVGTGGTITGTGEVLKAKYPSVKIIAVEPFDSPVLSGGIAAPHKIQGIGAGFIPRLLNTSIIDEIIKVKTQEAFEAARASAKTEGLLVGISSGAALFAATQIAKRPENAQKNIVVLLPDSGERYLSTELFVE